jgi:hypothetical protein
LDDYRTSADKTIASENVQWAKASKGEDGTRTQQWKDESHRHNNASAWVVVSKSSNGLSGFLVDSRAESIRTAAYGPATPMGAARAGG